MEMQLNVYSYFSINIIVAECESNL